MLRQIESDNRTGPRYLVTLEVRAEWDDLEGTHVVAEGTTENVGPMGTLVHLPRRLPDVGSRVRLEVLDTLLLSLSRKLQMKMEKTRETKNQTS